MYSFGLCKEMCAIICICCEMWHFYLQHPLKQQILRNIGIFKKLLYDVWELQKSVDEMLLSATPFVTSFLDDLEMRSPCAWSF